MQWRCSGTIAASAARQWWNSSLWAACSRLWVSPISLPAVSPQAVTRTHCASRAGRSSVAVVCSSTATLNVRRAGTCRQPVGPSMTVRLMARRAARSKHLDALPPRRQAAVGNGRYQQHLAPAGVGVSLR